MDNFSKKMNDFLEKYYWFIFAGLAVFAAMLCFLRLDVGYVASWDEARHGISAYEMIQNKNFIVNTYNYDVDYWNLKPPFSFYGIMLGFSLFGYSVMGLRFYSALSYFLICILCTLFVKKHHGKMSSLLTMAFLCCNQFMLALHGARAGDADALYQLFFTIAMLAMMEIPEKHSRSYVCGVCFSFAFLTKSYHAGIILVIGGLYMLISGQITKFKVKEWILFVLSMAIPAGIWVIARFTQDGLTFFMTMLTEDVLSRSSVASEGHTGNALFYVQRYLCKRF
jgi:4-amino-4-deoxy-L-arabinose transferase-like glycosyltransferase